MGWAIDTKILLTEGLIQLDRAVQSRDKEQIERCSILYGDYLKNARETYGKEFTEPYESVRKNILNRNVGEI